MILVIDGQGGGIGRMLVQKLKKHPECIDLLAVGTNATATAAMLRAGADAGATGENAVLYNCARAHILLGPSGIGIANAMHGEISPAMAAAVCASPAQRFLLPMDRCAPSRRPQEQGEPIELAADRAVSDAIAALRALPRQV